MGRISLDRNRLTGLHSLMQVVSFDMGILLLVYTLIVIQSAVAIPSVIPAIVLVLLSVVTIIVASQYKISLCIDWFWCVCFLNIIGMIYGLYQTDTGVVLNYTHLILVQILGIVFFILSYFSLSSVQRREDWIQIFEATLIKLIKYLVLLLGLISLMWYALFDGAISTSYVHDYNYFSLVFFVGICAWFIDMDKRRVISSIFPILVLALTITISGSRRGIFLLAFLLILVLFKQVRSLLKWRVKTLLASFFGVLLAIIILISILHSQSNVIRYITFLNGSIGGARWERIELFLKLLSHMSVANFLVGNGFDYIAQYAVRFNAPQGGYPHNPILSAFLYSGAIGFFLALIFYIGVLWKVYKSYHYLRFTSIVVLLCCYFDIFSSTTIFSNKIFCMFLILLMIVRPQANSPKKFLRIA